jgi:hypothetical protein
MLNTFETPPIRLVEFRKIRNHVFKITTPQSNFNKRTLVSVQQSMAKAPVIAMGFCRSPVRLHYLKYINDTGQVISSCVHSGSTDCLMVTVTDKNNPKRDALSFEWSYLVYSITIFKHHSQLTFIFNTTILNVSKYVYTSLDTVDE